MWVRRIARGSSSPSASTRFRCEDSGPGSTRAPSTSQQQITCGRPRWSTSIGRIAFGSGGGRDLALGRERLPQALLEAARFVAELAGRLLVAGPERDPV